MERILSTRTCFIKLNRFCSSYVDSFSFSIVKISFYCPLACTVSDHSCVPVLFNMAFFPSCLLLRFSFYHGFSATLLISTGMVFLYLSWLNILMPAYPWSYFFCWVEIFEQIWGFFFLQIYFLWSFSHSTPRNSISSVSLSNIMSHRSLSLCFFMFVCVVSFWFFAFFPLCASVGMSLLVDTDLSFVASHLL